MLIQPKDVRRYRTRRAVVVLRIPQHTGRAFEGKTSYSEQDRWLFRSHASLHVTLAIVDRYQFISWIQI